MSKQSRRARSQQLATRQNGAESESLAFKMRGWIGVGLFLFIFGVYYSTLYRTVAGGDSGELTINAYLLGVNHPPGYPLYTILTKLFTWIPVGSIAWRVNLASAFFSSWAAVILYIMVAKVGRSLWAGILAAGSFAFSPLVWRYATVAEVFSLNNLFGATLLYCAVEFLENSNRKWVDRFFFVFGLSLAHHHSIVLMAIPLVLGWIAICGTQALQFKSLGRAAGLFVLGLLPYAYLPWAAKRVVHPYSWGDTASWDGFWIHFLRKEYGTFQLVQNSGNVSLFDNLAAYVENWADHFFLPSVLFLILGCVFVSTKGTSIQKKAAFLFAVVFLFYMVVFHSLSNLPLSTHQNLIVLERFWQLADIPLFSMVGLGLLMLKGTRRWVLPSVAGAIVAIQVGCYYQRYDHRHLNVIDEFGRTVLNSVPKDSIIVTQGDMVSGALFYLQLCENVRPDIQLMDRGRLSTSWYGPTIRKVFPKVNFPPGVLNDFATGMNYFQFNDLVDLNYSRFHVYSTDIFLKEQPAFEAKFTKMPFGFLDWIVAKESLTSFDVSSYRKETEMILLGFKSKVVQGVPLPLGSWESLILEGWEFAARKRNEALVGLESSILTLRTKKL